MVLMHSGDNADAAQSSAFSEPLHVAIAGRDVPDYDIIELLIDAGLNLECKVYCAASHSYTVVLYCEWDTASGVTTY